MSEQPSSEDVQQQCIFCQIIGGQVPAKKVYEDDFLVAVLDINPAAPGHVLVLTKEHYAIMPQIPEEVITHLGKISKALSQVVLRTLQCEGTNIFVANGPAAGQRAQHFMLHIIPRNQNDGVGLELQEKKLPEELFEKLRQALAPGLKKNLGVALEVAPPAKPKTDVDLDKISDVLTKKSDKLNEETTEEENEESEEKQEEESESEDSEVEEEPEKIEETVKKVKEKRERKAEKTPVKEKKRKEKESEEASSEVSIDDIADLLR